MKIPQSSGFPTAAYCDEGQKWSENMDQGT